MRLLQDVSIRRKQMLIIMLTSTAALLLACAAFITYDVTRFRKELTQQVASLAEVIGNNCTAAVDFNDVKTATNMLGALRAEPNILAACVYSRNGQVFAVYPGEGPLMLTNPPPVEIPGHRFANNRLHLFRPITQQGEELGTIYLSADLKGLTEWVTRYAGIVVLVFVASLLVTLVLSSLLQRVVSEPILKLAQVARSVAIEKDYTVRATKQSGDESQSLYHSLVEQLPTGVFRKDSGGRYVFANASFCQIVKLTADQILGKTPTELVASMPAAPVNSGLGTLALGTQGVAHHALIMQTGERIEVEDQYAGADGKPRFYHTVKSAVFDSEGRVVGTQGILFDITERKRAEAALAEASRLMETLLENSPDFIYFKDRQSRFVRYSKTLPQHFHLTDAEGLRDKTDFDCYAEDRARAAFDDEQEIVRTGKPIIGKLETATHADGRTTWVLTTKMPWRDRDGNIVGTFGISKDVTALKEAEARLAHERHLLRALLDSFPDGIYFKDRESRFIQCSNSLAQLFKVSDPSLVISKTDFDFFTEEHARPAFEDEQAIIRTGQPIIGKTEKEVWPDGHVTWALTSKLPLRDVQGNIIGTFGISKDVTALKEAEAKLAHERQLLRSLLDSFPDEIYFKDRESRFIQCSNSLAQFFKMSDPSLVIGKTDFDFFAEEHARPAFEDEQAIICTGQPIIGKEEKETWPDGRVTWALTSKLPLRDVQGNIIGTFGISKNVTALKKAEAELAAAQQQLLETSRQAGMAEVATNVLHNVGNVLNSVNTSAGVLMDRVRSSKVSGITRATALLEEHRADLAGFFMRDGRGMQLLTYLKTLSEHLNGEQTSLLKELEELTRNIEHIKEIVAMQQSYARVSGVVETLSVSALVEDALRMHGASLARHEVRIVRQFDPVPNIPVDKHKVLQILVNLVSNALHALTDSAAAERRLTVSVTPHEARWLRVAIGDNGVGIAHENLTRIFSHGFTTRSKGHGFGLHSGALAAREMGGFLTAHSEALGQGANFILDLPIPPA